MKRRSRIWPAAAVLLGLIPAPARAQALALAPDSAPGPERTSIRVSVAPRSRLPLPAGADTWVDASSDRAFTPVLPGLPPVTFDRFALVVYRPRGDQARWEEILAAHMAQGLIKEGAAPVLQATRQTGGEEGNVYDERLYPAVEEGSRLVLGIVRNNRTNHRLVFTVKLGGKVTDAEALVYAQAIVELMAEQARQLRLRLPMPAGAAAAAPEVRLTGTQLRQLQLSILQDATVSPSVKAIARAVFGQATSAVRRVYRTEAPLTDSAFFQYFVGQAERLGWGKPVSKDETQPGRPTLLFQRPNKGGVVLIRAQATPTDALTQLTRPSTTIYVFEIEGPVNLGALPAR